MTAWGGQNRMAWKITPTQALAASMGVGPSWLVDRVKATMRQGACALCTDTQDVRLDNGILTCPTCSAHRTDAYSAPSYDSATDSLNSTRAAVRATIGRARAARANSTRTAP